MTGRLERANAVQSEIGKQASKNVWKIIQLRTHVPHFCKTKTLLCTLLIEDQIDQ